MSRISAMPAYDGLWLNDRQGVHYARRKPIEGGKDKTIKSAESDSLRRFSSQHIELVATALLWSARLLGVHPARPQALD
jgi:hypothetical protein